MDKIPEILRDLAEVMVDPTDDGVEKIRKLSEATVLYLRELRGSGEKLTDTQEYFLETVGAHFPVKRAPIQNGATILVECPHCTVSKGYYVSKDVDTILTCGSCEGRFRIAKGKFKEKEEADG